jgi:hypothetical protein
VSDDAPPTVSAKEALILELLADTGDAFTRKLAWEDS